MTAQSKADQYDIASDRGISKKLLKLKVKERGLQRKIDGVTSNLEADELSEFQMLIDLLGDYGELPLGKAALARAEGKGNVTRIGA